MGMGDDIKVSRFIQNDGWHFSIRRSHDLMDIFQDIPNEIVPWSRFDDEIVWTLKEHGQFSLKYSYNLICKIPNQQLQWTSAIWFKGCIKKHSVCGQMLLKGRLKTKNFLLQKHVDCDSCYALCDWTWETSTHLMIQCPYTQEIWKVILSKLNWTPINCNDAHELLNSVLSQIDQNCEGALTHAKDMGLLIRTV